MTTILPIKEIRKKVPKIVKRTQLIISKEKAGKFDIFKGKHPIMFRLIKQLKYLSKRIETETKKIEHIIETKKNGSEFTERQLKKIGLVKTTISSLIQNYELIHKEFLKHIKAVIEIGSKKSKSKLKSKSKSKSSSSDEEEGFIPPVMYNLSSVRGIAKWIRNL